MSTSRRGFRPEYYAKTEDARVALYLAERVERLAETSSFLTPEAQDEAVQIGRDLRALAWQIDKEAGA